MDIKEQTVWWCWHDLNVREECILCNIMSPVFKCSLSCHSQTPWQKSSKESGELGQSPAAQKDLSTEQRFDQSVLFDIFKMFCSQHCSEALCFSEQEAFSRWNNLLVSTALLSRIYIELQKKKAHITYDVCHCKIVLCLQKEAVNIQYDAHFQCNKKSIQKSY